MRLIITSPPYSWLVSLTHILTKLDKNVSNRLSLKKSANLCLLSLAAARLILYNRLHMNQNLGDRKYKILFSALILIIVSACTAEKKMMETPEQLVQETTNSGIIDVESTVKRIIFTIPEVAYYSDYIVIGTVKPTNTFVNAARQVRDCTLPSEHTLAVDQVYEISVDRYIKGDGSNNLLLIVSEVDIDLHSNPSPKDEDIKKYRLEKEGKTWKPLRPDHPYLLFVSQFGKGFYPQDCIIDGYEIRNLYVGARGPWIFDIENPESVIPENTLGEDHPLEEFSQYYPARPLDEILQQINEPFTPPPTADLSSIEWYPEPGWPPPTEPYPGPYALDFTPTEPYPGPSTLDLAPIQSYPDP
jgi:hypothetical protein